MCFSKPQAPVIPRIPPPPPAPQPFALTVKSRAGLSPSGKAQTTGLDDFLLTPAKTQIKTPNGG
jgi:hypothetical protein